MIPKREHNPELSLFSNFMLDLQDFKDRVVPMARELAIQDVSDKYQRYTAQEILQQNEDMRRMAKLIEQDVKAGKKRISLEDYEAQVQKEKDSLLQ